MFGKPDPEQTTFKTPSYRAVVPREDIETLIRYGDLTTENEVTALEKQRDIQNGKIKSTSYKLILKPSIKINAKLVDDKLDDIRVCDPAVGSGAFLVGMMAEIVRAKNALNPHLPDEPERTNYIFKRHAIQNCLYGVDIDPGAVEIAKLRLWLSLVVDEEDIRQIQPLPNLDYKIMQGNSLISEFMGIDLDSINGHEIKQLGFQDETDDLMQELEKKKDEFHNKFHAKGKEALRRKIEDLIIKIFETKLQKQRAGYFEQIRIIEEKYKSLPNQKQREEITKQEKEKLYERSGFDLEKVEQQLREYTSSHKTRPFFPWKLYFSEVFHEKDGFDVMIANPPYIFARDSKLKSLSQNEKEYLYQKYKLAKYQINTYPLFIEAAHIHLRPNGILSFITPNNWLTINTNRDLRKFILNQSNIVVVNFYAKVFESANVDSSIIIYEKGNVGPAIISLCEYETSFKLIKQCDTDYFKNQNNFIINIESLKNFGIADLLYKIESKSIELGKIATVKAGLKAYAIGKGNPPQTKHDKDNRIYHSKYKRDKHYLKYLDGRGVCRYSIKWRGEYLKYGENLAEPRNNFRLFSSKRILVRQIPSKPPYSINACLTDEIFLNDMNSINVINIQIDPSFVLGALNSKLVTFWFVHRFGKLQRGLFPQFKVNELQLFPIPNVLKDTRTTIATIADQILEAKKTDPDADTSVLEEQIDQMVYELYGLTPEEIAIVEGFNKK